MKMSDSEAGIDVTTCGHPGKIQDHDWDRLLQNQLTDSLSYGPQCRALVATYRYKG